MQFFININAINRFQIPLGITDDPKIAGLLLKNRF